MIGSADCEYAHFKGFISGKNTIDFFLIDTTVCCVSMKTAEFCSDFPVNIFFGYHL
jgi:hypothetical protein